jgi:hypothetical protein
MSGQQKMLISLLIIYIDINDMILFIAKWGMGDIYFPMLNWWVNLVTMGISHYGLEFIKNLDAGARN